MIRDQENQNGSRDNSEGDEERLKLHKDGLKLDFPNMDQINK